MRRVATKNAGRFVGNHGNNSYTRCIQLPLMNYHSICSSMKNIYEIPTIHCYSCAPMESNLLINKRYFISSLWKRGFCETPNDPTNSSKRATTTAVKQARNKPRSGTFESGKNKNMQNSQNNKNKNNTNDKKNKKEISSNKNENKIENKKKNDNENKNISNRIENNSVNSNNNNNNNNDNISRNSQSYSRTITTEQRTRKGDNNEDITTMTQRKDVHAQFSTGNQTVGWTSSQSVNSEKIDYNNPELPLKSHTIVERKTEHGMRTESGDCTDIRTETQTTIETQDETNKNYKAIDDSRTNDSKFERRTNIQSSNNPKNVTEIASIKCENLDNIDIFSIGNPTKEEIERRKNLLKTPNAIMIHPNRLLPSKIAETMEDEFNKERSIGGRIKRTLQQWSRVFSKKIMGHETVTKLEESVKKKYDDFAAEMDTTQNPHVVALRSLIDKVNRQTESSRAMEVLRDEMDNEDFWIEDFLPEFSENFLPQIVRAYFNDDLMYLEKICVGGAMVFCKGMIDARIKTNSLLSNEILWIEKAELVETKLSKMDKKPQLILRTEVQTVDCVYERDSNYQVIKEGSPSLVANNHFVMTLEPCLEAEYIEDIGFPWKLRSLITSKVKQLV